MEYHTFNERLKERINRLATADQLRFAIDNCKRLFPDYEAFCETHQWGEPFLLLDGSHACEKALVGEADMGWLNELRSCIGAVIPDSDDFGDYDGSYAQNAGIAVTYALQYVIDADAEHIGNIVTLDMDTVDFKRSESGRQDARELDQHSRMIEARRFLLGE